MREAHGRARRVLSERRAQMDTMARVLLANETVEGEVVDALLDDTWDEYVLRHPEAAVAPSTSDQNAEGSSDHDDERD